MSRHLSALAVALTVLACTLAAPADITLSADADAFVQKGYTSTNYGGDSSLTIKGGSSSTTRKGYIRFLLPATTTDFTDATLSLTVAVNSNKGTPTSFNVSVWGLNDSHGGEAWVEGAGQTGVTGATPPNPIIWNNAPANDTADNDITSSAVKLGSFQVTTSDVTGSVVYFRNSNSITTNKFLDFLNDDTNGMVTLILRRDDTGGDPNLSFASKESTTYAGPLLTLVPEPATMGLLSLGALALLRRRKA